MADPGGERVRRTEAVASLAGNVSSVVTAPEAAPSRPSETTPQSQLRRGGLSGDLLLGVLGAIVLTVVAFLAGGGDDLSPNTWVQEGLVVLAALVTVIVLLFGARGRAWGGWALAGFVGLAVLTYASIGWSVAPDSSWTEGNRTLSYLAAFAVALLLARLAPGRWRALLGAVATAASVVCGWALLVKVFPATLDPNDPFGRLSAPFGYWNAVGVMGAIGLPACLWAGARRERSPLLRAVSAPAIAVLVAALVLSFSRGAVIAAVVGAAIWFGFAPLRLRSALVLLVGAAGGAAISVWGATHHGITTDNATTASRVSAGHGFGVALVVVLVLTMLAGLGAQLALDRVSLADARRRRIGAVLIVLVALIPVGGVVAVARSSRGLTGDISHLWKELTNPNGTVTDATGRLVQLSNSRPHYWGVALKVGEHHPLAGVGALGFQIAQDRYAGPHAVSYPAVHAHSYVFETFADFGAIGLAVSLGLLLAWALATGRTLGLSWHGRRPGLPRAPPASERSPEWIGMVALLAIVVTFGVHSMIDWTWFVPGVAVIALACAGWLAGRGPLGQPVGRSPQRRMLLRSPGAIMALAVLAVVTVAAVWEVAQPLRSADSSSAAEAAAYSGNGALALTEARRSAAEDPVSVQPLYLLADLESLAHDPGAARQALAEAVSRQPQNPRTWEYLGCFDLSQPYPGPALRELHRGLALNPWGDALISTSPKTWCALLGPS